jgi:hypothetical protein
MSLVTFQGRPLGRYIELPVLGLVCLLFMLGVALSPLNLLYVYLLRPGLARVDTIRTRRNG